MAEEIKELQELLPQGEVLKVGPYQVVVRPYNLNDWVIIFSRYATMDALNINDVSVIRLLVWLQIRKDERYKTVTEEEVGEVMTLKDIPRLVPILERLVMESLPEEETKKGEGKFRGRRSSPTVP